MKTIKDLLEWFQQEQPKPRKVSAKFEPGSVFILGTEGDFHGTGSGWHGASDKASMFRESWHIGSDSISSAYDGGSMGTNYLGTTTTTDAAFVHNVERATAWYDHKVTEEWTEGIKPIKDVI